MVSVAALAVCCLISGDVKTPDGSPIAGAHIAIHGKVDRNSTSDARGHFQVHVDRGSYAVSVNANGFSVAEAGPLEVDHDTSLAIALEPNDSAHLRPIAEVFVDGRLALSRSTIPSVQISRQHLEDAGNDRIIDGLLEVPSVTLPRPDGGAATAPALVALRGPDPSETLVTLDGQILNDGNTGDLDLSRFPVAAFSGVDVTEGLGAKDLNGSNTIGGGVNILSLRPTKAPHNAFSLSTGSFGATEGWYNLTGTRGRFGYALALDDQQEQGYVNQDSLFCTANPCVAGPGNTEPIHLGSTISSRSALANLTWNISQNADVGLRIFSLGNSRDETGVVNAPDVSGAQLNA
ncbi:MAG: TonB-dependent receptor, partial [Candidatus Eremiobacteraeota bacterium]|nr:TonB-dependent receptor [Candidatus Eremiobacteraeota bacterium]